MSTTIKAKFDPGQVVATPTFMRKVGPKYATAALLRHLQCDWGMVDQEDWERNDQALKDGGRLLSSYPLPDDADVFWIITEAADEDGKRSVTTLLLPSDY